VSEKVKLKISPVVAAYAAPGVSSAERLGGIEAAADMTPVDRVTLLFCLMRDRDVSVRDTATAAFALVPEADLQGCINSSVTHPAILDAIARVHHSSQPIVAALLANPALSRQAADFLKGFALAADASAADDGPTGPESERAGSPAVSGELETPEDEAPDVEAEPVEEDGDFLSKFQLIQQMGISEKIKMALTGDKEWRSVLINDNNKLVSGSVIKNPRITDGEIIRILKVGVQNDEIIRLICANKEWLKNYQIRKALVESPKTPLPNALRILSSLGDKDIAGYAKSKNISTVISTHAKRIILAKKR